METRTKIKYFLRSILDGPNSNWANSYLVLDCTATGEINYGCIETLISSMDLQFILVQYVDRLMVQSEHVLLEQTNMKIMRLHFCYLLLSSMIVVT